MSQFTLLTCPACGAHISIDGDSPTYRCEYCGNSGVVPNSIQAAFPHRQDRAPVPQPASVVMDDVNGQLRIERRWYSAKYIPLAFFCVAWDAFLCFWYSMAFSDNMPWIMIVFPIAHVAVGVGLTYSTLAGFLNTTILKVDRGTLSIDHGPLPWLGNVKLSTDDLQQLYTKEKVTSGEHGRSSSYDLFALTREGKTLKLLSNLDSPDVSLFIEQQIERWLGIKDKPVGGELPRYS